MASKKAAGGAAIGGSMGAGFGPVEGLIGAGIGGAVGGNFGGISNFLTGDTKPRTQYYGGSEEAAEMYRQRYRGGEDRAQGLIDRGNRENFAAAARAGGQNAIIQHGYNDLAGQASDVSGDAANRMSAATNQYNADRRNYAAGRAGIQNSAQTLERSADNMVNDYQRTDQMAFDRESDQSVKKALSAAQGSGGGALAMRNALTAQASANVSAQGQAGITRAQQTNQLLGMQNDARTNAANLRVNLGQMDQNNAAQAQGMAQYEGNRQLAAQNAQSDILGAKAGIVANEADRFVDVGSKMLGAGVSQQNSYLGAQTGMENAQLNAAREQELARQKNEKGGAFKKIVDPGGLFG